MITSLLLSLREGLEAALVIGIVYGALHKTGRTDLNRPLWAGALSAVIISLFSALLLLAIDKELEGIAEKIFEGVTLLLAAGVLTWMIFWMRRQSGSMKSQLESKVNRIGNLGGGGAIYFLTFIAVLREGVELALYLTASSLTSNGFQTLLGTAIGLLAASLLGYLIFTTTLRLNLRHFFQVTTAILILFSIVEFNQAGIIPAIISPIWNLNPFLNDHSIVGTILSTLFGYHGNPSLTEVLGYSGYLLVILWVVLKTRHLQTE
jgi:high-affinity iron transporter